MVLLSQPCTFSSLLAGEDEVILLAPIPLPAGSLTTSIQF